MVGTLRDFLRQYIYPLFRYDFRVLEWGLASIMMAWGVSFLAGKKFPDYIQKRFMLDGIGMQWFGLALFLVGAVQFVAVSLRKKRVRQATLILNLFYWSYISFLLAQFDVFTGYATYPFFAWGCMIAYWRLGRQY